ncbi:Translation initiation factor eIF-2B subunit delta [Schistosoma japonicum]|nr:Translation initiation factor eIF-2B subunit delta [Schistosoma japonicum]
MTDIVNQKENTKSKAQLRAERRAIQEAQRAAKATSKGADKPKTKKTNTVDASPISSIKGHTNRVDYSNYKIAELPTSRTQECCRVHLFKHLDQPDKRINVIGNLGLGTHSSIHPSFLALGVDFDEGRIQGSNERCLAFLSSCEELIRSFSLKSSTERISNHASTNNSLFCRSFGPVLQTHVNFLQLCCSLPVTIANANQYLKQTLTRLDFMEDWEECQASFLSAIDEFRRGSIYLAGDEIVDRTINLIRSGECVCIFGYSSLVARVLERAWRSPCSTSVDQIDINVDLASKMKTCFAGTKPDLINQGTNRVFSVLIVDSRPKFEGRRMLARLSKAGIPCEYTHIGALPSVAKKISLVILGAHALLSNGYVLGHMGTAQVANIAASISHAPTIVCAETYKFWERAHSDAFEYNELGDPDDIWRGPRGTSPDYKKGIPGFGPTGLPDRIESTTTDLSEWRSNPRLRLLHLEYDVLPPTLVTAVVTEKGTLPTTSVPVVLRVKQASVTMA